MTPEELRTVADRYRDMALQLSDPQAIAALREFADRYEAYALAVGDIERPAQGSYAAA